MEPSKRRVLVVVIVLYAVLVVLLMTWDSPEPSADDYGPTSPSEGKLSSLPVNPVRTGRYVLLPGIGLELPNGWYLERVERMNERRLAVRMRIGLEGAPSVVTWTFTLGESRFASGESHLLSDRQARRLARWQDDPEAFVAAFENDLRWWTALYDVVPGDMKGAGGQHLRNIKSLLFLKPERQAPVIRVNLSSGYAFLCRNERSMHSPNGFVAELLDKQGYFRGWTALRLPEGLCDNTSFEVTIRFLSALRWPAELKNIEQGPGRPESVVRSIKPLPVPPTPPLIQAILGGAA